MKMPADASVRLKAIDALRGFALLGICIVNLPLLARSWDSYQRIPETSFARAAFFANSLLFEAKFFTLFSFLYGIGIYILVKREGSVFLLRRFFALILAGALHAILLFPGDILLSYGILGFLFLPLSRMHTRALLVTAVSCLIVSGATYAFLGILSQHNYAAPPTNYATYGAVVTSNLNVYPYALGYTMLFNWPGALAMICLGFVAARENWLSKLRLNRFSALMFAAGIAGNLLYANAAVYQLREYMPVAMLAMAYTAPLLSLTYAEAIFSLSEWAWARRLVTAFSAAGRLSLTNYVLQSLIAGIIFHGYGVGLYNKVSQGGLIFVSLGIFVLQLALSDLWLRRFDTGPLECLLRSFSHLTLMPLRRSS